MRIFTSSSGNMLISLRVGVYRTSCSQWNLEIKTPVVFIWSICFSHLRGPISLRLIITTKDTERGYICFSLYFSVIRRKREKERPTAWFTKIKARENGFRTSKSSSSKYMKVYLANPNPISTGHWHYVSYTNSVKIWMELWVCKILYGAW